MFLYDVFTPREIEEKYSLPPGTVRRDLSRDRFWKSEVRKSGATWLVTGREARRIYGDRQLTLIPVKDDEDWVYEHCQEELKDNDALWNVLVYFHGSPFVSENDKRIIFGEYNEGIRSYLASPASEDGGEYIPFGQWLNEQADSRRDHEYDFEEM